MKNGSEKQIAWAERIVADIATKYPYRTFDNEDGNGGGNGTPELLADGEDTKLTRAEITANVAAFVASLTDDAIRIIDARDTIASDGRIQDIQKYGDQVWDYWNNSEELGKSKYAIVRSLNAQIQTLRGTK